MEKDQTRISTERRSRLSRLADQAMERGDYFSALKFIRRETEEFGDEVDGAVRLADAYEAMLLHEQAVKQWFRVLDRCSTEDFPDVYEGLATNFFAMGDEGSSAYYYNRLIDVDSMISEEFKQEVVSAFSKDKKQKFRVAYPPEKADYTKEVETGATALKNGDVHRAIALFKQVPKGATEYAKAREMEAVAHLLSENTEEAERVSKQLLSEYPDDVQAQATLAAVYMEQGKKEESRAIAERLVKVQATTAEEAYKIATVACENGLHAEAYALFSKLRETMPYDAKTMYFQAVSAYKSGHVQKAMDVLDDLCVLCDDAEVAKYYLRRMREQTPAETASVRTVGDGKMQAFRFIETDESNGGVETTYYYRLPEEERVRRVEFMSAILEAERKTAEGLAQLAERNGYFAWCFDEMDGMDKELQFFACLVAEHAHVDEFLRKVLVDPSVADALKVEILRLVTKRNKDDEYGVVLCNIYREVPVYKIAVGRTARRKYLEAYAYVYSKFAVISDTNAEALADAGERLYIAVEERDLFSLLEDENSLSCALYVLGGLKEFGSNRERLCQVFGANEETVTALLQAHDTVFPETDTTKQWEG